MYRAILAFVLMVWSAPLHAAGPWEGVWDHVGTFNDVHLRQDGRRVWGDYLGKGPLEGRVSPDGSSIRMTWVYDTTGSGPFWPPNLNPDDPDNQALRDWLNFTDQGETEDIVANPGSTGQGGADNPFGTPDLTGSRPDGPVTAGPVTRAIYNRGGTQELGRIIFARYGAILRGEGRIDTDLAIGGPKAGSFDFFIVTDPRDTAGDSEEVTLARRSGAPSFVTGTIPKRAFTSAAERILGTVTFTSAANTPMELEFRKVFDPATSAFGTRTFMVVDLDPGEALAVWGAPFNTGSFLGALPPERKGISVLQCMGTAGVEFDLEAMRDQSPHGSKTHGQPASIRSASPLGSLQSRLANPPRGRIDHDHGVYHGGPDCGVLRNHRPFDPLRTDRHPEHFRVIDGPHEAPVFLWQAS